MFYQTVRYVNSKDYTKEQPDAWATGKVDLRAWNKSFLEHNTVVAVEDNIIVGFGDIDETGYLDRLYVHKDHQKEEIASAICDKLEQSVNVEKNYTRIYYSQTIFRTPKVSCCSAAGSCQSWSNIDKFCDGTFKQLRK